ncbi:MAG: pyridoxal phosphate enzyme (YggS family) [Glaciecola sp.]|jgi:pyridoxal phosphate enzyme (YggS family)
MAAVLEPTAHRLHLVRERIVAAAVAAGRDPSGIRLIAVSKTHAPSDCAAAIAAGVADLGENRVQELVAKADRVAGALAAAPQGSPDRQPAWHLIGPLQSNKVGAVVNRGWWLHTLDRRSVIDRVARLSDDPGLQRVLLQVNIGADPAKSGCTPREAPALLSHALESGLDVRGLMTVPPLASAPELAGSEAAEHFAALQSLQTQLRREHDALCELSMGMSSDLEAAITHGATMVRIGTAIFGDRGDRPWRPASTTEQ